MSMATKTTPGTSAAPEASPELTQIERGLTTIVRWGNLPRVRERFTAVAGMDLDRASYAVLFRLEEGPARLAEAVELVPDRAPQERIDAGGRLVEDDELRLVDQGTRELEAALHAARQPARSLLSSVP